MPSGLSEAPVRETINEGPIGAAGVQSPATLEPSSALRPLPRYGRSPRLQQEQSARHAARAHRYEQVKTRFAQGQSLRQIAAACGRKASAIS
jgi:hypothetical protein